MKNQLNETHKTVQPKPSLYQANKLRISAGLNLVGDMGLLVDGVKKGETLRGIAGGLYSLGAITAAVFGKLTPKQRFEDLKTRTAEFLQSKLPNGIADTEAAHTIAAEKLKSPMKKAGDYLRHNSGQVMLWFYSLGAGVLFANGLRKYTQAKEGERPIGELLVGGFSLLVKITSALLPEKKSSKNNPEIETEQGFWQSIKSQPMKVFGYGSLMTEAFWAYDVYEKKQRGDDWQWTAFTTGNYAASDLVIATAKKDVANNLGDLRVSELDELEEMIAESISQQTPQKTASLVDQSATFLEEQSGIVRSKEELAASIERRISKRKPRENWTAQANEPSNTELAL